MDTKTGLFVPWRDDALLGEESVYALWNKISWFSAVAPTSLVRCCRWPTKRAQIGPREITYEQPGRWTGYLENPDMLPRIHGRNARDAIDALHELARKEVPGTWASDRLRICEECITEGVHLRIHQHLAVGSCPLHGHLLRSTCKACGAFLPYASVDQKAFCCQVCGSCLLNGGDIRFDIPDEYRSKLARLDREVHQWLRPLSAGTRQEHLRGSAGGELDHPLANADERSFLLTALRSSSAQTPPWLTVPASLDGDFSIAAIRPEETSLIKSFRRAERMEQWSLREDAQCEEHRQARHNGQEKIKGRVITARYRQAFIRVTSNFLNHIRTDHSQCLDTPYLIAGEWDDDYLFNYEILDCCPIALGFWLWRKRVGMHFTNMAYMRPDQYFHNAGITSVGGCLDLLLYALGRSDLHACVLVAHQCSEHWKTTRDEAPSLRMLNQWRRGKTQLETRKSEWLDFGPYQSGVTFVRTDATRLIKRTVCSGREPYYKSLRRKLRSVPYVNRRKMKVEYLNMEHTWEEQAYAQVDPFEPMNNDWVFLKDKQCPPRRGGGWLSNFARFELTYGAEDHFACVNSAINLRTSGAHNLQDAIPSFDYLERVLASSSAIGDAVQ